MQYSEPLLYYVLLNCVRESVEKVKMPKTRQDVDCRVFGALRKFKDNMLPTCADVIRNFLCIRQFMKEAAANNAEPAVSDINEILLGELKLLWVKASIPIISDQQIKSKLKDLHQKYRNLKKPMKSRNSANMHRKVEDFRDSLEKKLFDIASCKCSDYLLCKCKNKIPTREHDFIEDQRHDRKMIIGSVDKVVTKKLERSLYRKIVETQSPVASTSSSRSDMNLPLYQDISDSSSGSSDGSATSVYEKNTKTGTRDDSPETRRTKQMRISLPNLAQACDRTGVSDRAASLITNSVLQDLSIILVEHHDKIIDRSKIRRERKKMRNQIKIDDTKNFKSLHGIYFDGRRDKTLQNEMKDNKYYRTTVSEEHVVLVSEPQSKYIGHIRVSSGNAEEISGKMLEFLNKNVNLDNLVAVGCDGTAVNTGIHNGVIRKVELAIGRSMQWFICILHTNELPLRHLIKHLDGATVGPHEFSGQIGKELQNCEHLPVVTFEKIRSVLPNYDAKEIDRLSTDQKYLYEISNSVSNGEISSHLARRQPGKISHARWLTTASRILRLYVATAYPSENLKSLVCYIQNVYVPLWFEIKARPFCFDGPVHLFNLIKRTRYLALELRKIVDRIIQINGYYAHPENVLIAMLCDERRHIRELGLRRILKSRNSHQLRKFEVPKINFNANNYTEMINWQQSMISEPPMTKKISTEDLTQMIKDVPEGMEILRFPCHSQAIERCVKLVTEASSKVCGPEARDGFIRSQIASRQELPHFNTKGEFLVKLN